MRVAPRAWIGIGVWLLYVVIIVAIQGTSGIRYDELGDSAGNLWRDGVLSVVVGGLVVAAVTARLGWFRAAMRERPRTRARWTIVAPALVLVVAIGNCVATDWGGLGSDFLVAAIVLGVCVGFSEEFATRGAMLVGLRGTLREVWVVVVTCVCFGLMHGVNILLGAAAGDTILQIFSAGLQGVTFYILRRVTGSLVWPMLLHGFWDFSIFVQAESPGSDSSLGVLELLASLLSLVFVYFVIRDARPDYGVRRADVAA